MSGDAQAAPDRRGRPRAAKADALGVRQLRDRRRRATANRRSRSCAAIEPAVVTMDLGLPPHPDDPSEGLRAARGDPVARARHQGHRADRPERSRQRAEGDRARRPRLLHEAVRARAPGADDRPRVPRARAAGGEPAAAGPATQAPAMAGHHHARSGDAAHLPHDRESGAHVGDGADPRRVGHRQGAARARAARAVAAAPATASSRSTARRSPRTCSRASSSATRRARSPARRKQTIGQDRDRARRHALPRRDRRPADALQAKLLRFLQERVIERVGGRQEIPVDVRIVCATHQSLKDQIVSRDASARTSTTGSPRSSSRFRRCARARRRGAARAHLRAPLRRRAAPRRDDAAARMRSTRSRRTRGRATCASSRTSSSAR